MSARCKKFNEKWRKTEDDSEVENEVITFGNVELSEDEIELLNLGPSFMVMSDLIREDMQTECAVTLTKVRWGRMGKGQSEMTDRQVAKEEEEKTESDILEDEAAKAIEDEARDVISSDGNEVCMG